MIFKKSFGFLEIIAVLTVIGIFYSAFILKFNFKDNELDIASNRLLLYLKYTRIQAMIDDKYDANDSLWHKKRWSLKFLRCQENIGGLYYSIYSDTNKTGQIAKLETLKDPLTNKYVYSDNSCEYKEDRSKYVLLTKEFGITKVEVSCNDTQSLGQLSFGNNGELYAKLSDNANEPFEYKVQTSCQISLYNDKGDVRTIKIEPETGFIENFQKFKQEFRKKA